MPYVKSKGYRKPKAASASRSEVDECHRQLALLKAQVAKKADKRTVAKKADKKYSGAFSSVGGSLGSMVGNMIAPGIGGIVGGGLGSALGSGISKITGFGDYEVKSNTLVPGLSKQVPSFGNDAVRVKHRELIAQIKSSTGFSIQTFPVNPGVNTTFPWLSQIAQQFEQYHMNGLVFEYVSTSADALNSTNTALGSVIAATQYNSLDPAFDNIQQMMAAKFATMGKPSLNLMHAVECDPDSQPLKLYYVRSGSVSSNQLMYDLASFQFATFGSQAVADIGYLWVTYDVTFVKPQLNNVLGLDLQSYAATLGAPSASNPFGASGPGVTTGSNLQMTYATNSMFFPAQLSSGRYLVEYTVRGASAAVADPTVTYTNCHEVTASWYGNTVSYMSNTGTTSGTYFRTWYVEIDDNDASFNFNGGTLPGGGAQQGNLVITQVPVDLTP